MTTTTVHGKYCRSCGKSLVLDAVVCPYCGVQQKAFQGKSRIATALLAFFLGGFGLHRFYLGQMGLGLIYLLFCWTAIPSIIAFIEGIYFLLQSDEAFNEKYGLS